MDEQRDYHEYHNSIRRGWRVVWRIETDGRWRFIIYDRLSGGGWRRSFGLRHSRTGQHPVPRDQPNRDLPHTSAWFSLRHPRRGVECGFPSIFRRRHFRRLLIFLAEGKWNPPFLA